MAVQKETPHLFRFTLYAWGIVLAWSALLGLLMGITVWQVRRQSYEQAKSEARGSYNKETAYRKWVVMHGGVYVPVTEKTPPNPNLKHVPERDISTPSGRRLTLMNAAYMIRQVHETAADNYGPQGHLTSLNPLRPENRPDAWETIALQSFARGETEYIETTAIDGKPFLRTMHALITEESCLKCHAVQGYKEGDVRGGLAVSIPLAPYLAQARANTIYLLAGYGLVWALGLLGLGLGTQRLRRRVSERDQAQLELGRLNRELIGKKQEMENILYITTHDLRSPLINIQGFSQNLERHLGELRRQLAPVQLPGPVSEAVAELTGGRIPEALKYILEGSRRMDSLINSLLKVARLGRLEMKPETLEMNSLVKNVVDALRFQLEEAGGAVKVGVLPPCRADAAAVNRLFTNLLENAIKYRAGDRALAVSITGEVKAARAFYTVADNGSGIAAKDLQKIWDLFYRAGDAPGTEGEGIGLTVAKTMAEKNNGSISAESKEGQGSAFYLELPAAGG